jgi:hypothetical protein
LTSVQAAGSAEKLHAITYYNPILPFENVKNGKKAGKGILLGAFPAVFQRNFLKAF